MTRFEKDMKDALEGNEIEVLKGAKRKLNALPPRAKVVRTAFAENA